MPGEQRQSCGVSVSFDDEATVDPSSHQDRARAAALLKKILPYDAWVKLRKPTAQEKTMYRLIVGELERITAADRGFQPMLENLMPLGECADCEVPDA